MSEPQQEDESETEAIFDKHLFVEEREAFQQINVIVSTSLLEEADENQKDQALARLRFIWDKYLECPTLLDSTLERVVEKLCRYVLSQLVAPQEPQCQSQATAADTAGDTSSTWNSMEIHCRIGHALSALYALSKVRGRKTVQRFFPHSVHDLVPVWRCLESLVEKDIDTTRNRQPEEDAATNGCSGPPLWESVYILVHWMNTLSLVPFDCDIILERDEFWPRFRTVLYEKFHETGPVREAATACMARWLARPDFESAGEISTFVSEVAIPTLNGENVLNGTRPFSSQQHLGILECINALFKTSVPKNRLVEVGQSLWDLVRRFSVSKDSLLIRKQCIKFWVRFSCTLLPVRPTPAWRYKRGRRRLMDNHCDSSSTPDTCSHQNSATNSNNNDHGEDHNDLFTVPDSVEDSVGFLLDCLGHSSTLVRWSSAKGIGRISERLPFLCVEDILDAVLERFDDYNDDRSWHGACLTLAEMARRGLILPARFVDVIPQLVRAIGYDLRKGTSSVGAHVRDSACYTYWAFARAYSSESMKPYINVLNRAIVIVSLFDREVNCRRAASAAFQEAVGRQGAQNVPQGIEILQVANYFSLGNRSESYLSIAPVIASFPIYKDSILQHIIHERSCHWDISIRLQTSKALCRFPECGDLATAVPTLVNYSLDPKDVARRHGAVLCLSEVLRKLYEEHCLDYLCDAVIQRIIALPVEIDTKRLYRGRGGEHMRTAVCLLITTIAHSALHLEVKDQVRLLDILEASIPHPSDTVRTSACDALSALLSVYFPVRHKGPSQRLRERVVARFVQKLDKEENPAATRGYAAALGKLPSKLLAPDHSTLETILECLTQKAHYSSCVGGEGDAETRKEALLALVSIAKALKEDQTEEKEYPQAKLERCHMNTVVRALLLAFEDYKSDRRGDVGSWCRAAAMEGLQVLITQDFEVLKDIKTQIELLQLVLKQSVEPLSSIRTLAWTTFCTVANSISLEEYDSGISRALKSIARQEDTSIPFDEKESFQRGMDIALLTTENKPPEMPFLRSFFEGMILSLGCRSKGTSENARSIILAFYEKSQIVGFSDKIHQIFTCILNENNDRPRVMNPLIKTLHEITPLIVNGQETKDFLQCLLAKLRADTSSCTDVARVLTMTDIIGLVSIGTLDEDIRFYSLESLVGLLEHKFPRVRTYAADHVHATLLHLDTAHEAQEYVLTSPWGTEMNKDEAHERRVALMKLILGQTET